MRNHIRKQAAAFLIKTYLVMLLFQACALAASPVQAREEINIGLIPEMNLFAQMQRFQPLADHLSRETGLKVHLVMLSRYSSILDSLKKNEINAAFLGSYTAALAIDQLNAIPVARPVNLDSTSTYHGYIFVRKDSLIKSAEDMAGKTMAFVEQATTAGYVFPLAWLRKNGIKDYTTFFKSYFFAGSHDSAIDAVLNKKAHIGAAKNTIYEHFLIHNPNAQKELSIIATSPSVPSNGLCVMPTVSKEAIAKLETALMKLDKTPQGKKVLYNLRALKFVKTDVGDYEPVRRLALEAGISLTLPANQNN